MDKLETKLATEAQRYIDLGNYQKAYEVLRPMLEKGVPEALFLYSTFSVAGTEPEVEFERRSVDLLKRASEGGYAPAIYALAACYETGDLVAVDPIYAASLFKLAAEKGFPKAKFRHGLNLYYGSNGISQEKSKAQELIRLAAQEGVEDAQEMLREIGA